MGLAHDVSHELRGEHGKWSKGGAAIDKMAAEAAGKSTSGHKQGDRVKYKTGALGTVHHVDEKGKIHVVWDRGRGKPVATPAHHLTGATDKKPAEQAARETTGAKPHVPYKPPRQAGSRGGVPAPTTGPDLAHERFINDKLAGGQWHDPTVGSKDRARVIATLSRMESSGKVESRISPTTQTKQWRLKSEGTHMGVPAGTQLSPEMMRQLKVIRDAEQARMAAENKARHPGGSVTEYKDMLNKPSLSGGATPPTAEQHIATLNRQWKDARQRADTARGPSAAQSADRRRQQLEDQLKAAGAVYKPRVGWSKAKLWSMMLAMSSGANTVSGQRVERSCTG